MSATVAEVAEALRVPVGWLRSHARELGAVKQAGRWTFEDTPDLADLERFGFEIPSPVRTVTVRCPSCGESWVVERVKLERAVVELGGLELDQVLDAEHLVCPSKLGGDA